MKRKIDRPFPSALPLASPSTSGTASHVMTRRALLAALPALGLSACIGSFAVTNRLLDWNQSLGNKWVNWLVFVVLMIIPVYPLVWGIVDLWVFNSIEFWTGNTPLVSKETPDGGRLVTEKTDQPNTARLAHYDKHDELLTELLIRRDSDDAFTMLSAEGEVLAQVSGHERITLRDGQGRRMARLDRRQIAKVKRAMETGQSPSEQTWSILEENQDAMPLLSMSDKVQGAVRV